MGKRGKIRKHLTLPIYRLTQRGLHGVHRCLAQRCKGVNRGSCCLKGIINNKGITIVQQKRNHHCFKKRKHHCFKYESWMKPLFKKESLFQKKRIIVSMNHEGTIVSTKKGIIIVSKRNRGQWGIPLSRWIGGGVERGGTYCTSYSVPVNAVQGVNQIEKKVSLDHTRLYSNIT